MYDIRISKFHECEIRELIETSMKRRIKHLVVTTPRTFRGKSSGPPFVYVWWYNGDGQYFYVEDLRALLVV